MLAAQGIPVVVAVAFPGPVFRKDFDLKVGLFAALLAAAFEELFQVIDVRPVGVGKGRQATGVPAHAGMNYFPSHRWRDVRLAHRPMN